MLGGGRGGPRRQGAAGTKLRAGHPAPCTTPGPPPGPEEEMERISKLTVQGRAPDPPWAPAPRAAHLPALCTRSCRFL